jgi:hypothetical protein
MGRRPRTTPPWSSAKLAQAECQRRLGDKRCAAVLKGIQRRVARPRWQYEAVTLARYLRALGHGLRELEGVVNDSWALAADEKKAFVPEPLSESLKEAFAQLRDLPVSSPEVFRFFKRLMSWLEESRELMDIARRMQPRKSLDAADQGETGAIARILVTFDTPTERPVTKQIAALLEVANGKAVLGDDPDARASAWEKRLEKWKKALERARESAPRRRAPAKRTRARKIGGDKRSRKRTSVPRK